MAGVQIPGQEAELTSAFLKTKAKAAAPRSTVGGGRSLAPCWPAQGEHLQLCSRPPGLPPGFNPEPPQPFKPELWAECFWVEGTTPGLQTPDSSGLF